MMKNEWEILCEVSRGKVKGVKMLGAFESCVESFVSTETHRLEHFFLSDNICGALWETSVKHKIVFSTFLYFQSHNRRIVPKTPFRLLLARFPSNTF